MNVLILNTVALNGGDGAILQAVMHIVRAHLGADTRFVAHESKPEVAARYYPEPVFRTTAGRALGGSPKTRWASARRRVEEALLRRAVAGGAAGAAARRLLPAALRRVADDYREADLVVSTGGTYLVETYSLHDRLLAFDLALAAGRPLVLFTQSMGPFRNAANRAALARILPQAALVLLRDELSLTHVRDLGIATDNARVVPDSVFALARPERLAAAATLRANGAPLRVAVSVRDWAHFAKHQSDDGMTRYRTAVREAVTRLVERHRASVVFLSTCQGIPEYWTDDSRAAREMADGLPEHVRAAVTVDERFHAPDALMTVLEGFDFVVSTRMHMAIMALNAGIPVLPIAYEFKTRELFRGLGEERWVHDIDDLSGDVLARTVDDFVAALPELRGPLFAAVARDRVRALESGAALTAITPRS